MAVETKFGIERCRSVICDTKKSRALSGKSEGACLFVTTGVDVSVGLPLRQERMARPAIGATKVDESCFPYQ
jgi:hypothetical protein